MGFQVCDCDDEAKRPGRLCIHVVKTFEGIELLRVREPCQKFVASGQLSASK